MHLFLKESPEQLQVSNRTETGINSASVGDFLQLQVHGEYLQQQDGVCGIKSI